ncbi:MAG: complex I subunit 1 family protein [Tepidisphaeraceae bacterium]
MLDWIRINIPAWVYITIIAHLVVLGTVAYLILLERKVASWAQDRIGPNRVGLTFGLQRPPFVPKSAWTFMEKCYGLGQPLADGLKFILKEDYAPGNVDKILFTVAPAFMILVIIISIAVLPWGGSLQTTRTVTLDSQVDWHSEVPWAATASSMKIVPSLDAPANTTTYDITYSYPFQIARLNIGVLFILATLSLAVYGVVIGGWASNNKYSFLGGLRATANMISYEIPLGLAVLCLVLMFGTLDLGEIVEKQCHYWWGVIPAWNVFSQPLAFVMFLICMHAEANRAPFDLAECEQELVGGYHTEYSAMRFALFFLAEYAGMITTSAVCVALFLGGWHIPWIEWLWKPLAGDVDPIHPALTTSVIACIIRALVFFGKTIGIIFVFMWVRWSLPRFRFDQLMMLAWRALIPRSLVLLTMRAVVVFLSDGVSYLQNARHYGVDESMEIWLLVANVVTGAAIVAISTVLPLAPPTNRRVIVKGSRLNPNPQLASNN